MLDDVNYEHPIITFIKAELDKYFELYNPKDVNYHFIEGRGFASTMIIRNRHKNMEIIYSFNEREHCFYIDVERIDNVSKYYQYNDPLSKEEFIKNIIDYFENDYRCDMTYCDFARPEKIEWDTKN